MKPRSAKRARQDREVNDLKAFAEANSGSTCWLCHFQFGSQIHHIFGRASKYRHHMANLWWTCEACHEDLIPLIPPRVLYRLKKRGHAWATNDEVAKELTRAKNGRVAL